MRLSTTALAVTMASFQMAEAVTHYGCWSEKSSLFRKDCVVAFTSLVMLGHTVTDSDKVQLPRAIIESTYGSCKAQITSTNGGSVSTGALLSSFDQLAARCQNGYFFYDSGWVNANIQGHAGWKRDESNGNVTIIDLPENVQLPTGAKYEWETPTSPVQGSIEVDSAPESHVERGHVKSLSRRAKPVGQRLWSGSAGRNAYELYRGTVAKLAGMTYHNVIVQQVEDAAKDLIDRAVTNRGSAILRVGVDQQEGATARVLTLAMQLAGGFNSWQALFNSMGDGGDMVTDMIAVSCADVIGYHLTGAAYNLYNHRGDVVLSFILNGVGGTGSALPSS